MPGSVVRVAHLVSHPIQYFAPLYRELARRPDIDLTVYFYSDATVREFYDVGFGRRVLFSQAWGLYIGEQSRRYFERYGVPPSRLVAARYCVDNRFFQQRALELRAHRADLRA